MVNILPAKETKGKVQQKNECGRLCPQSVCACSAPDAGRARDRNDLIERRVWESNPALQRDRLAY